MKKVKSILTIIIVLVVLAAGVGFFFTFFNPKTKTVSRFVLRYNGQLVADGAEIVFPCESVRVQARHVFEFAESDTTFTVKVVPNAAADFTFRVGGVPYKFSEIEDLTPAFTIGIEKDGFTLNAGNIRIQSVLSRLFVGTVTVPDDLKQDYFYTAIVTSANGEAVTVRFRAFSPVTDIELSEGDFYF